MGNPKRSAESGKRGRAKATVSEPSSASDSTSERASDAPSFEVALERLEGTVDRLEEGEMPLEEALALFESGVKLSRQCSTTLEAAERRIEILVADRGSADGVTIEPFESDEAWDDDSESESGDEENEK